MTTYNEDELIELVSSANMFIVTPIDSRNAWTTNNDLVQARMAKRDKAKRAIVQGLHELAQGLERGATLTTTNKKRG